MARHAEDTLGGASIAQVFDFALAIPTPEAVGTEGLITSQDGQVFYLVATVVAAVGAVVTDQRAIAEKQEVRIRVEEGAARVAAKAVDVPSVSRWGVSVCSPEGKVWRAYRVQTPCPPRESRSRSAIRSQTDR